MCIFETNANTYIARYNCIKTALKEKPKKKKKIEFQVIDNASQLNNIEY